ncbi:beta strand repeat-containing protein, partial [Neptunomonas concharum]|uniref:beta strand repeat-containing protein n=1 Tax=Neptunomonas concharum TaxID=1031538 RepID=UPI001B85B3D5
MITDEPVPTDPDADTAIVSLVGPGSVVEGEVTTDYTVSITEAPTEDLVVTFDYTTTDADGNDYVAVGSVTILAGQTSATFPISTIDDNLAEGSEDFTVSIASVGNGGLEDVRISTTENSVTTTITDETVPTDPDADTAIVSLVGPGSVVEGEVTTDYTVSITEAPTEDLVVTFDYTTTDADGNDYVAVGSVTILAGQTSATFPISTIDDNLAEGSEDFTVSIASVGNGGLEDVRISTTENSVTTTITDETVPTDPDADTAIVSLVGPGSVVEGEVTTDYTVSITEAPTEDLVVTFSYTVTDADGTDYDQVGSVTILAGTTSTTFTINTIDDNIAEGDEDFTVSIDTLTNGGLEDVRASTTENSVTTTISDEPVPTDPDADTAIVRLVGPLNVVEGSTTTDYSVSITQAPETDLEVTFSYTTTDADGNDYVAVGSVTIPAGQTTATFAIDTLDDNVVEGDEDFTVSINTIQNGGLEDVRISTTQNSVTTTIEDNDTVGISVNDVTVNEDDGSMTFTVTLSNPSTLPVTVDYATQDGTATAGLDYTAVSDTLTFAPGVTSLTVTIPVADDFIAEGGETLDLVLSNPTNATITDDVGLGIIQDEPTPGPADTINVTLSGPATVAEGATATYTVTLSAAAITDMVVDVVTGHVTTDNGDLVPVTQQVTIAAGTTTATLDVTNTDDAYAEGAEDYTVTLTGSFGGGGFEAVNIDTTPVTTTINDNSPTNPGVEPDAEVINITLTGASDVAEGGTATYTIHFDQPTATPMDIEVVTGHITTEDGDLVPTTFTVTVPAGVTSHDFTVSNNDDNLSEGDEDYSVALTGVTSGGGFETINVNTGAVTTTITDDEVLSISVNDVTVNEDAGILTFTVSLSVPTTADVTFDYATADNGSALAGSDYTAVSGSATIPAGSTQVTIDVPITDDVYLENPETFLINLTNISSGVVVSDAQGQGTILDDSSTSPETSTLTLTSTPSVQEGGTITYTVDVDNAPVGSPLVVTLDNGAIITIPVGATTGSVDVTAPDDVYVDPDTDIVVGITSATGGEYEALDTSDTTTTVLSDDSDTTTVTLEATPAVEEGGTITYTATVDNAPEDTPLVITLDNGATITIPVGGTTGSVDVTAPDDVYVDPDSDIVVGISSTTGGNYENLDTTDTATTVLSDDSDLTTLSLSGATTVAEGGDATYTLTLSNPAETDMTVDVVTG